MKNLQSTAIPPEMHPILSEEPTDNAFNMKTRMFFS